MRFGVKYKPILGSKKRIKKFALIPNRCIDDNSNYVWVWFEYYYQQYEYVESVYNKCYWIYDGKFTI